MISPRATRLLPLLLPLVLMNCRCNDKIHQKNACQNVTNVQKVGTPGFADGGTENLDFCSDSGACADHFSCNPVKDVKGLQCCVFSDRKCNTEADCCPGQTCPAARKKCFDSFLSCDTDADCGDEGDRFCTEWTDSYGTSKRCQFKACSSLGECPSGQACFKGECMATLPCDGTCPAGQACVPESGKCQAYACAMSCAPGFIATFKDTRNIWDSCRLPDVGCECAELPDIQSGDLGRFSALAIDNDNQQILVSQYDGEYGDLVVDKFSADGKLLKQDYVDGVPTGTPKYGPSGARGGIADPGPDVGRYTDIAYGNGAAYVSYYDVTNGDLKLAVRQGDGSWTNVTVDGQSADLGLYSSIALDPSGLPAISYFQRGGNADFNPSSCPLPEPTGDLRFITALKIARATSPNPGPSDFTIQTIACLDRPPPPCDQCNDTCADPGTGPDCYPADNSCAACDPNTEACVSVGGTPTCAKKYNPANLNDVIDGVGLFSSIAFQGNDAIIAYMDREFGVGSLYGVRVTSSGPQDPVLLDYTGDTGYFPDVKVDPATQKIAISYHDFSSRALKFYFDSDLVDSTTPEVIDPGTTGPGSGIAEWVGTDSGIAFAPDGSIYVAYQNATSGDLELAHRSSSTWSILTPLRTEGAVGFFADAAFMGPDLYVSHAKIHARLTAGQPAVDNSLLLERYTPP